MRNTIFYMAYQTKGQGITQFRQKTYAMYNTMTTYSNSHNNDWGIESKQRLQYSCEKYKKPHSIVEKPVKIIQKDNALQKAAQARTVNTGVAHHGKGARFCPGSSQPTVFVL